MKVTLFSLVCVLFLTTILLSSGQAADCDDPNIEAKDCGTACEVTCSNKDEDWECIDVCVPGCFCKSGYVLDETTNRCVTSCP